MMSDREKSRLPRCWQLSLLGHHALLCLLLIATGPRAWSATQKPENYPDFQTALRNQMHIQEQTSATPPASADHSFIAVTIVVVLAGLLAARRFAPALGRLLNRETDSEVATPPATLERETAAVAQFAAKVEESSAPKPSPAEIAAETLKKFFELTPDRLEGIKRLFAELGRAPDANGRQKRLSELREEVRLLCLSADVPQLQTVSRLGTALKTLLDQMADRPGNFTASTVRTAGGAIVLLEDVCKPGLRPDLLANPPIRLLAVDDDLISRHAVSGAIKKTFPAPDLAANGGEALALAAGNTYDAVFLDVEMPGMDGFEVCTRLRQLPSNAKTTVIFVTSHSDFDSRTKSLASGGRDLIAKPFLSSEITVKALTWLLRSRMDREKEPASALAASAANGKEKSAATAHAAKPVPVSAPATATATAQQVAPSSNGHAIQKTSTPRQHEQASQDATRASTPIELVKSNVRGLLSPALSSLPLRRGFGGQEGGEGEDASHSRRVALNSTAVIPAPAPAADFGEAFLASAPEHLQKLKQDLASAKAIASAEAFREIVGEFYVGIHIFSSEAEHAKLAAPLQIASAIKNLVRKLLESSSIHVEALDSIAPALDALVELCKHNKAQTPVADKARILVVDDDVISRRAISSAVQMTFGKPDTAEDGETAVALALQTKYDLIFMDVCMPGMDGWTACDRIRQTTLNDSTPVIFVTSQRDIESREEAKARGASGYIVKPVLHAEIALTTTVMLAMRQNGNARVADPQKEDLALAGSPAVGSLQVAG